MPYKQFQFVRARRQLRVSTRTGGTIVTMPGDPGVILEEDTGHGYTAYFTLTGLQSGLLDEHLLPRERPVGEQIRTIGFGLVVIFVAILFIFSLITMD